MAEMWRAFRKNDYISHLGISALVEAHAAGIPYEELMRLMEETKEKARQYSRRA